MPPSKKSPTPWAAVATASAALVPMAWLWGFTVDDALITARLAHQLASGNGYRFNATGPITDAVTPLGWVFALEPFAASGPWPAFMAAKYMGALAWLLAAAWCGRRLAELGLRALLVGGLALLVTTPLAAWSVAGMETGVVIALAALACGFGTRGRLAAGLCAALRPELAPWALALLVCEAALEQGTQRERLLGALRAAAFALSPFILVAVLRSAIFGAAYPLAVEAKPPDLAAGVRYALGALAFSGPVWLISSSLAFRGASRRCRAIVVATLVHALSLMVVGGDWMPLYRLFVPILPGVILAGAEIAQRASRWSLALRCALLLASTALVAVGRGSSAARVGEQRRQLIDGARPWLAQARNIATLDIGWVGTASNAHIVDLAGVTDPRVARLPGGHTTKRLPDGFLYAREVDTLVLLAHEPRLEDWPDLAFVYGVEHRLLRLAGAERFQPVATVPLLGTRQAYVIARVR